MTEKSNYSLGEETRREDQSMRSRAEVKPHPLKPLCDHAVFLMKNRRRVLRKRYLLPLAVDLGFTTHTLDHLFSNNGTRIREITGVDIARVDIAGKNKGHNTLLYLAGIDLATTDFDEVIREIANEKRQEGVRSRQIQLSRTAKGKAPTLPDAA